VAKDTRKITVALEQDEWYPVYTLKEIKKGDQPYQKLKLPKELFDEYQSLMKVYDKLHTKIRTLAEQQNLT
jgi:hypothetical protein